MLRGPRRHAVLIQTKSIDQKLTRGLVQRIYPTE
jgi:hypothetical protein